MERSWAAVGPCPMRVMHSVSPGKLGWVREGLPVPSSQIPMDHL